VNYSTYSCSDVQRISTATSIINQTSDRRSSSGVYTSERFAPRDRRRLFIEPARYGHGTSAPDPPRGMEVGTRGGRSAAASEMLVADDKEVGHAPLLLMAFGSGTS